MCAGTTSQAAWRIRTLSLLLAAICYSSGALAGSQILRATIINLEISKSYGNFVFIGASTSSVGAPTCETGSWQYTLTLTNPGDSQIYALLLTAYATGAVVNLQGAGSCNEVGFVESLQSAQLTQ